MLSIVLTVGSQSLGYAYFDPRNKIYPLQAGLYAGLHRATFAIGICSIVVLLTVGDGLGELIYL